MVGISLSDLFSKKNIATFTLVFMSVQVLGIEGFTISTPKVIYMCLSPILILVFSPRTSKVVILSVLFWGWTFLLNQIQFDNQRTSTFYYTAMFLSVFCLFYNLVWEEHCYDLEDFLIIVKMVIYAYAICLVLQQVSMLIGWRYLPIINLMGQSWQSVFRLNSLAIEPSHSARVLTVYFYAFLKLTECKYGRLLSIYELFKYHYWLIIAFLYTMIAMGSGTAMVGLALLILYFFKRQYAMVVIIVAFAFYYLAPYIDYEPFNRALDTFNAAITMDELEIRNADSSASSRVNMLISFRYLDLYDAQTWFGHGVDSINFAGKRVVHVAIYEYGLISYFLKILLIFSCSLCGFFSLSTLMFIILFSANIGNIAYGFACLMVFSTLKYFRRIYHTI